MSAHVEVAASRFYGLEFTEHAKKRWRSRFKKLRRPGLMEDQAARAKFTGKAAGTEYYTTPCGAVLAVEQGYVKTVLLGRQIRDGQRQAMTKQRNVHARLSECY